MRVRETPAISSAVMKEPTRARAMHTPRLSARVKGGRERGGVAGRLPQERRAPGGVPGCPQTHPAHARQRWPRCPAPGRTARPGCSPPAPRKHLQGSEQSEAPPPPPWTCRGCPRGAQGTPRGAHRGSGAGGRRWQGLSCAPASSPLPRPPASPGKGAGHREARAGGQGEERGEGTLLTFILRTPASPWIPAGTEQRHPTLAPGGTRPPRPPAAWHRGEAKGQLLTQPQLHLIVGQLEGGLGAGDAARGQAEPQGACRRRGEGGLHATSRGRRRARGQPHGEAGMPPCPGHAAGTWGARLGLKSTPCWCLLSVTGEGPARLPMALVTADTLLTISSRLAPASARAPATCKGRGATRGEGPLRIVPPP